jgi:hypothetical protein
MLVGAAALLCVSLAVAVSWGPNPSRPVALDSILGASTLYKLIREQQARYGAVRERQAEGDRQTDRQTERGQR